MFNDIWAMAHPLHRQLVIDGNQLPQAPKWTANFTAGYDPRSLSAAMSRAPLLVETFGRPAPGAEHRTEDVLEARGGATAVAVVATDDRFAAGVNMDGRLFGQVPRLDRPFVRQELRPDRLGLVRGGGGRLVHDRAPGRVGGCAF